MPRPVYARIQDLRDEGLDPSLYPDARALVLLERAADVVERLTDQRFGPKREHFFRDGRNGRIVVHPKAMKIVEIETLKLVLPDHTAFTLSPQVFVVYDRYIRLRRGETGLPSERAVKEGGEAWTLNNYSKTRREITLPDELHNTEVTGTFGWLENSVELSTNDVNMGSERLVVASSKEVSVLTADVDVGDTVIHLGSTGTLQIDDVLHVDPQGANFWVIIGGVFRWLDSTLATLSNGATSIHITNASQAFVGDKVTISDGTTTVKVVITSINVGANTISFAAISIGAAVIAVGAKVQAAPIPYAVSEYDTVTTEPLIPGGSNVQLFDVSNAQVGDVLTIDDGNTQTNVQISSINSPTRRVFFPPAIFVNFNALSPGNISGGAQVHGVRHTNAPGLVTIDSSPGRAFTSNAVVRWGRVPRGIREAVIRIVLTQKAGFGDTTIGKDLRTRIEKTDNYQYEYFPGINLANLAAGTGDPFADNILSRFRAPPFASYV